jgi:3-oxoacyl-[acyl-carrier protein] reductase
MADYKDDFKDRVVIITGAGVGIGYALCKAFAMAGAKIVLNDLDPLLADESAKKLNAEVGSGHVHPYGLDVADVNAVRRMVMDSAMRFGRLDVVIANAGITNYGAFLNYHPENFDRITSVNLRGTYFTAQAAAREMIRLNTVDGRILLTSSVTGVQGYPNLGAYGITKAGIIHMAKVLALELGEHGISVNAICPGIIATERTRADDPNLDANWLAVVPNKRVGQVEDITATALFLASPGARHVTGQNIIVDGGWTQISPIPGDSPILPEVSSKLK